MGYVSLAGLLVLLLFALFEVWGHMRRSLESSRSYRHGDDSDWECSSQLRFRRR